MRSFQRISALLVIAVGAYWVTFWRFFLSNNSDLQNLIDGTALKPFQYRALVPLLERYLIEFFTMIGIRPLPLYVPTSLIFTDLIKAQVVFGVEWLFLFALVACFWRYLDLLLHNEVSSYIFSLLLFTILPVHYMYTGFPIWLPYDTPSILVFVLGLTFLFEKRTLPFYLLLAVGTFNRETTIFLVLLHVFVHWRLEKRSWIATHFVSQLGLWIAVKLLLFFVYQGNGGEVFELHVWKNLRSIFLARETAVAGGLYGFVLLASVFGFLWVPVVLFRKLLVHEFVRSTLLVVPFFVAGMMLVGLIIEIRIFGELIPIVLSAFALILAESLRRGRVGVGENLV